MKEKMNVLQMIGVGIAGFAGFILMCLGLKEKIDEHEKKAALAAANQQQQVQQNSEEPKQ